MMKTKMTLMLALAAGSAIAATASAQQDDSDLRNLPPARAISLKDIKGGDYIRNPYDSRVDLMVFGTGTGSDGTGGSFAGPGTATSVYMGMNFGGPAQQSGITIDGIAFGIWTAASDPLTQNDQLYMLVSWYPNHLGTGLGTNPPYSGTPVQWFLNLGTGWTGGNGLFFPNPIGFSPSAPALNTTNVFNSGPSDLQVGLREDLFRDAAATVLASSYGVIRRANNSSYLAGSQPDTWGWYQNANPATGLITSDTTPKSGGGAQGVNSRGVYADFNGSGYTPPPPPVQFDFGCLADGATNRTTDAIAAGGKLWYKFCLNANATDDVLHFLDVDTEGSAAPFTVAVFDTTGNTGVNGQDYGSGLVNGSGHNAKLSFGIGRRNDGGTAQYDGRNFYSTTLGLAAGSYYLNVATAGSSYGNGFTANAAAGGAGALSLHFHTNTNGAALAASAAPDPILAAPDFGTLSGAGAPIPAIALGPNQVAWYKFTTCAATDNANNQVTIDMNGSSNFAGDTMTLFDGSGNLVTQATGGPPIPSVTFNGTTVLPAGTYYLVFSYDTGALSPSPATNGRWAFRSLSGNNGFTFAGEILLSSTWSCGPTCPPPCIWDYDDNPAGTNPGLFPDNDDIIAFFADWTQGTNCWDVDINVNGAGLFPDNDDIIYFFLSWTTGNCNP